MNDFAQIGISFLVIALKLLFQIAEGNSDRLEENCGGWFVLVISFHGVEFFRFQWIYI